MLGFQQKKKKMKKTQTLPPFISTHFPFLLLIYSVCIFLKSASDFNLVVTPPSHQCFSFLVGFYPLMARPRLRPDCMTVGWLAPASDQYYCRWNSWRPGRSLLILQAISREGAPAPVRLCKFKKHLDFIIGGRQEPFWPSMLVLMSSIALRRKPPSLLRIKEQTPLI